MKVLLKRMAVMSAALVLLCVNVVAQNEKSTESVTANSHGVIVTPTNVELRPGEEAYITVVVEPGYRNPLMIYLNGGFTVDDEILDGSCFSAILLTATSDLAVIHIIADPYVKVKAQDEFYVRAMVGNPDYRLSSNTTPEYGVPVFITVDPDLEK